MRIIILLSVFNGDEFLSQQIESILTQNCNDFHLIIRDDGSTDGSRGIIERYQKEFPDKITFLPNPECNVGLIESLNILYKADTSADYYMFSDQDDVWLPDKIGKSLEALKFLENGDSKSPAMICSDSICVDRNLKEIAPSFFLSQKFPSDTFESLSKMIALNVVQGCTMMVNRSGMSLVFPLPYWLKIHDSYISVRIAEQGKISYIHSPTMLYRQHEHNALGSLNVGARYYISRLAKAIDTLKYIKKFKGQLKNEPSMTAVIFHKFKYAVERIL